MVAEMKPVLRQRKGSFKQYRIGSIAMYRQLQGDPNHPAADRASDQVVGRESAGSAAAGLARLVAAWTGDGSNASVGLQTKWNNASAELNAARLNLGQTIQEAGQTMASADKGVAGSYGGGICASAG